MVHSYQINYIKQIKGAYNVSIAPNGKTCVPNEYCTAIVDCQSISKILPSCSEMCDIFPKPKPPENFGYWWQNFGYPGSTGIIHQIHLNMFFCVIFPFKYSSSSFWRFKNYETGFKSIFRTQSITNCLRVIQRRTRNTSGSKLSFK